MALQNFDGKPGKGQFRRNLHHCFVVGNTIVKCPECAAQPWSEEFLEAKNEIEGPNKVLVPF